MPEAPDFRVQRWSAKQPCDLYVRVWSEEQAAVIGKVQQSVASQDTNVQPGSRFLLVTGGPGTGKTGVVIYTAANGVKDGCRVLIACPVGALIKTYKEKFPPYEEIVI